MNEFSRNINAMIVIAIAAVLFGSIFMEYYQGMEPCPLCVLQKLGMASFAAGELLNLRFGVRTEHYALSYLGALFGGAVSVSQILLHICEQEAYALEVFGLGLYTWAFIVFVSAIFANTILLFFYKPQTKLVRPSKLGVLPTIAFILIVVITFANTLDTFFTSQDRDPSLSYGHQPLPSQWLCRNSAE